MGNRHSSVPNLRRPSQDFTLIDNEQKRTERLLIGLKTKQNPNFVEKMREETKKIKQSASGIYAKYNALQNPIKSIVKIKPTIMYSTAMEGNSGAGEVVA